MNNWDKYKRMQCNMQKATYNPDTITLMGQHYQQLYNTLVSTPEDEDIFNDTYINSISQKAGEISEKFEQGHDVYSTDCEQAFINHIYPECPNISIDYGIMEKATNVYVMLADFGWSDLGTWGSLHEITAKDNNTNAVAKCEAILYNAKTNIIALPDGELAVIDGLENYLVARDNGVLLICPKDQEAKIRQYVKDAEEKYGNRYI